MNKIALKIKNLTCGYDNFSLDDINLQVKTGEFMGIIGPNGSGKTTFLKAITRLLKPRKGIILFDGEDIWQMGFKDLAKKIAVVSQNTAVNFMNVEEFILMGRIPHYHRFQFLETDKDKEIAQRAMFLTDILKFKSHPMTEISGGERQLAFIARALAQEPDLLLLDEPTSHLDIAHQVKILDLIKRLNKTNGLTVIMVLHDLNLAAQYCHRLVLFNNGFIHKIGAPIDVLTYQIIEEVYKTVVVVEKNPISGKPYILMISEEDRKGVKNYKISRRFCLDKK